MKKTWFIVLFSLLFVCSAAAFAACSKDKDESITIDFATYETWDEGFSYLSIMDGFGRISKSSEQAHGGTYSAKVQPLGSHTDPDTEPFFYYPMKIDGDSGYDYSDFSYLNNIRFWMYNAQPSEVSFDFCIVASIADIEGADCKAVQDVKLAPKAWTEVAYEPDYDALQNMCDVVNIAGIAFRFDNCKSADISAAPVLYLDDVTLHLSETPNIVVEESIPARGEIQSFDAASSLVYVNMDSGIDFAETWLPAGDPKLPEGVKGGVEFTITDAEIGTWPRFKFDSRTPQADLEKADYFSLMLYFDVPDPSVDTIEIRMVPDTNDVYTEYVPANEWAELNIDTDIIINNWSTVIGVQSRGLFWVQNGAQGYCFNAIDAIRVADIKGVFNDVRVPAMPVGSVDTEYVLPEATLELNGTAVTAESWSYAVEYSDKALYEAKYGEIALSSGRAFTPAAGGTYSAMYSAVYQGQTYTAKAEFEVNRSAATDGEIESFDDPSSVGNVRMESGRTYTATYLWAGDEKLEGAKGASGGVSFAIPSSGGTGSWPMFYVNSRSAYADVENKGEVSFWIYLGVEDESKLTEENREIGIRVALFPRPGSTGDVRVDKYVLANTWTKITVTASNFASCYDSVSVGETGFFWVQNGAPADVIGEIRIANIMATGGKVVRDPAAENEVENFGDIGSVDNLRIPNDVTDIGWMNNAPGGVGAIYATLKRPQADSDGLYPALSIAARRTADEYAAVAESNGYNAVTMQIYLEPVNSGDVGKLARMNYWGQQSGMNDSQGAVKIGQWVTLTFDLDTYLAALRASSDKSVQFLWVHSTPAVPIDTIYLRNVQLAKADDVLALDDNGLLLFESDHLSVGYDYVTSGVPDGETAALKATFTNSGDNWPNLKFSADKNMLGDAEALKIRMYIEAAGTDSVSTVMWPAEGMAADNFSLQTNQWITVELEADALRALYGWSLTDDGAIATTCPLWFTNTQTVSAVYIAGIEAGSLSTKNVAFAESGISISTSGNIYKVSAETPYLAAEFNIDSTNGYAYKVTLKRGETMLEHGTDYTIRGNDGALVIKNPAVGSDYTVTFESYNGRFVASDPITLTVTTDLSVSISGGNAATAAVNEPYTFPSATLQNADDPGNVTWSYTVNGTVQTENFFTPTQTGEYTIGYVATYYGSTFTGTLTLTVANYTLEVAEPAEGTTGTEYTLPTAELKQGAATVENVTFTYKVTAPNGDDVQVPDGKFTPFMAGDYTVEYSVEYNGKPYSAAITVTVNRVAAAANEIESFNDEGSLVNVRLESGDDFAKTYLSKDTDSAKLPANAEGGVSFAVGEGSSWPRLYFKSRIGADRIEAYDHVVIPLYIHITKESAAEQIMIKLLYNDSDLYVAPNTWVYLKIDAKVFADWGMAGDQVKDILWVQNGLDDPTYAIDEIRVASVYAENTDNMVASFADSGSLANVRLESGDDFAKTHLAKDTDGEKLPQGAAGGVSFTIDTRDGGSWPNLYFDSDLMGETFVRKYAEVVIPLYIGTKAESGVTRVMIQLYNGEQRYVAANTWVNVTVDAKAFADRGMTAQSNSILWVQNGDPANVINEIRIASVYVTETASDEILSFADSASLVNVRMESGDDFAKTYLAKGTDGEKLPGGAAGGVSFAIDSRDGGSWPKLYFDSAMFKSDIKEYDTVVIPLYIGSGNSGEVMIKLLYNGSDQYVALNTWVYVEIDATAFADFGMTASGNGIFWVQNGDNSISEIRIASVYAEKAAG